MQSVRPQSAQPKSHGSYAKHFDPEFAAKQSKPKLAIIHPLPTNSKKQPSQSNPTDARPVQFEVQASRLSLKPTFQDKTIEKKPVPGEIVKPFLYVQKVVPKRKTQDTAMEHPDQWNYNTAIGTTRKPKHLLSQTQTQTTNNNKSQQTSIAVNAASKKLNSNRSNKKEISTRAAQSNPQTAAAPATTQQHHPAKQSLYDIEQRKRQCALQLFQRLSSIDNASNLKVAFWVWAKQRKLKVDTKDMMVNEQNFLYFMKELSGDKIKPQISHNFFECFHKPPPAAATSASLFLPKPVATLSIKALAYNFENFLKSRREISNILSEKAAQNRYLQLRSYADHWNRNYPEIKQSMKDIKEHQEQLRYYFKVTKESYRNPYQQEIKELQKELLEPIIKYDRLRKEGIQKRIEEYKNQHQHTLQTIQTDYARFCEAFEEAILPNHNLFFKKKAMLKLVSPILEDNNLIYKETIEQYVGKAQQDCEIYLNSQRQLVDKFIHDKQSINEDVFTLGEVAMFLFKHCKSEAQMSCMQKLVKLIKRQHCLKQNRVVFDINQFPSDEEIELDLMLKCFDIECTRVLFKNDIWSELLAEIQIPDQAYASKFHSQAINMNITTESIKRLFERIDMQMARQLCKSREISKMVKDVGYHQFGDYADIISNIDLDAVTDEDSAQTDQSIKKLLAAKQATSPKAGQASKKNFDQTILSKIFEEGTQEEPDKKVKFADLIFSRLDHIRQQDQKIKQEELENKDKPLDLASLLLGGEKHNLFTQAIQRRNQEILKAARQVSKEVLNKSLVGFNSILNQQMQGEQKNNESKPQLRTTNNFRPGQEELSAMKTMAKSFMVPQPINVNALDVRFHDKAMQQQQDQRKKSTAGKFPKSQLQIAPDSLESGVVGKSILLQNLPKVEQLDNQDPLRVSKYLLKTLDGIDKENKKLVQSKVHASGIRDGVSLNYFKEQVELEKRPKVVFDCQGNTKYSMLLPVGYYADQILEDSGASDKEKWYLRPHHVESLTENPLSRKDNLVKTEYNSRVERLPPNKRPEDYEIDENVRRKQALIDELEERVRLLKEQAAFRNRDSSFKGGSLVSPSMVDNYLSNMTKNRKDKDLEAATAESLLYDLRRQERQIVVGYRNQELSKKGFPTHKWWEMKDKEFVNELIRHKNIQREQNLPASQQRHLNYIRQLDNEELY